MEKKKYTNPEFEVVDLDETDVITASGDGYEDDSFGSSVPDFV